MISRDYVKFLRTWKKFLKDLDSRDREAKNGGIYNRDFFFTTGTNSIRLLVKTSHKAKPNTNRGVKKVELHD